MKDESIRLRLKKMAEFLRELAMNDRPFGQPNCDRCVEFLTATRRISELSHGVHQWTSLPVIGIYVQGEPQFFGYLIVCYSNPDPTGLPNHLCFRVPLVMGRGTQGETRCLLVCFAAESIVPLSKGMYWDDGEPMYDSLEDFCRFYDPLRLCFWPEEVEQSDDGESEVNDYSPNVEHMTLAGISYKDSIEALIRSLSQAMKEPQNA